MNAITNIETIKLKAPFPWFGGKSKIAADLWLFFGADVANYVEPFFGSGACLLGRPGGRGKYETVNDLDCFLANFWRAVKYAPEEVAFYAEWPINETDLEARHYWLVTEGKARLSTILGNPDAYDAKIAGWWVWGACAWIASGWCSGTGPWSWSDDLGEWSKANRARKSDGINRKIPRMSGSNGINTSDNGVIRKLPEICVAKGINSLGVNRQIPQVSGCKKINGSDNGINRQILQLSSNDGIHKSSTNNNMNEEQRTEFILDWMNTLSDRLRHTRVTCGDWKRIIGSAPTTRLGITAVLLDPPYSNKIRSKVYTEDTDVTADVQAWCIENGGDPKLRIALCGYEGEHEILKEHGWSSWAWKANGGYSNMSVEGRSRDNAFKETVWVSPHCLKVVV